MVEPYNFEMASKLEISPYLFNHHYNSNNPKILAPIPVLGIIENVKNVYYVIFTEIYSYKF